MVKGVIAFNQHFYYDDDYYLINQVIQFSDFNFTSEKRHSLFSPLFLVCFFFRFQPPEAALGSSFLLKVLCSAVPYTLSRVHKEGSRRQEK